MLRSVYRVNGLETDSTRGVFLFVCLSFSTICCMEIFSLSDSFASGTWSMGVISIPMLVSNKSTVNKKYITNNVSNVIIMYYNLLLQWIIHGLLKHLTCKWVQKFLWLGYY